jgi:hypothetical protein
MGCGTHPTGPAAEALRFKIITLDVLEFDNLRDEDLAIFLY